MTDLPESFRRFQQLQAEINAAGLGDPRKTEIEDLRAEIDTLRDVAILRQKVLTDAQAEAHRLQGEASLLAEALHREKTENERLRAVVEAARQLRAAKHAMMTRGWEAHSEEPEALSSLFAALAALDRPKE
jgi:predicted  nucleic acid-binding Zn-ribbon protein